MSPSNGTPVERDPVWMGTLWECPQVFTIDGQDVMLSSIWDADELHYAGYAAGTFRDGRFDAERWGRLTWGSSYYAPSLFTDKDGEQALTFWLRGVGGEGWEGAHSIPYRLHAEGGVLIARPHPDVAAAPHTARRRRQGCGLGRRHRVDGGRRCARHPFGRSAARHADAVGMTRSTSRRARSLCGSPSQAA